MYLVTSKIEGGPDVVGEFKLLSTALQAAEFALTLSGGITIIEKI